MRKLRKNKFIILAITTIVVSIIYFRVQKAIDNYSFENNNEIITEEESLDVSNEEESAESSKELENDGKGEIPSEEVDLEMEAEEVAETGGEVSEASSADGNDEMSGNEEIENEDASHIYVYITGEVNNPGVVILKEGSRIVDAINSAGGTTSKANISKVNLVYVLEDGMKVNIPNNNDLKDNPNFEYITMSSGDGGNDVYSSGVEDSSNSSSGASAGSSTSSRYSIVNINTATQTELETLPGIGPSLALKIINYRKENGKFASIDEIKNVSGIGDSKFEDLKAYITI